MSRYPGCVWYRGLPVYALLDPDTPNSLISQGFLERSFGTDALASALDAPGTNTVSGAVSAETWNGVYVTNLPLYVLMVDWDVVLLGQDWILAAHCRRREDGIVDGWPGSWENDDCAWFSCAYHPGKPLCGPAEIRPC